MGGEASRLNGKKGGGVSEGNLMEGLCNLETGEPAQHYTTYFPSMKAAAHALKIDISILRDAKDKNCDAFLNASTIHKARLMSWLRKNSTPANPAPVTPDTEQTEFEENYNPTDEAGGVGQTLKSLQAYERRCKQALDNAEKATNLHQAVKAELIKTRQDAWIKVVNALLKYDLSVSLAKRESGELIPIADGIAGVQALLAWHTIATSDALRNVIPNCEGKTKYQIATLLDGAMRSSIYRNFKLGAKLGKIPEWMSKTATEYVQSEKPLTMEDF